MMEWIDVNDRLPDIGERVLAQGKRGGIFICKVDSAGGPFGIMDGTTKYRAFTKWMPLPKG